MAHRPLYRRSLFERFGNFGFGLFFAVMLTFALLNGVTVLNEWQGCSERGGRMVQGLSWNGYVCVEGK